MTPTLRVVTAGLSTTIQDSGRHGFQRLGVSLSGALDPLAFRAANLLVCNPANAGVLEALYVGPTFAIEADSARLAFAGANATIEVFESEGAADGESLPSMQSVRLRRGQVIRVGSLRAGASLYIAVEGGFDIAPTLGSVATDGRGQIGGWGGRALIDGDVLPLCRGSAAERPECRIEELDLSAPRRFRTVLGPQNDYFSDDEIERFFAGEYTVTAGSNRMGLRLGGTPVRHRRGFNIVSDAIATGSIQIPGNGQPIVLLADHQTTGGYPKIATIISADLPALGRLPIGSKISFAAVSLEEAAAARRQLAATLDGVAERISRVAPAAAAVAMRLLECNLISGVHDAAA